MKFIMQAYELITFINWKQNFSGINKSIFISKAQNQNKSGQLG
jgi:hypothetical protein